MAMRRRTAVLLSAAITLMLASVVVGVAIVYISTDSGRSMLRGRVEALVAGRINGAVHLGAIRGSLWSGLTLDSLEIRDADDSVVVATGPITAAYDIADLFDRRIYLRGLTVERPYLHLRKDSTGEWTYKRLVKARTVPTSVATGRRFGDFVLFDTVRVRGGEFKWTEPWRPDAALLGTARDSAIAAELARTDVDIDAVTGGGFVRVRHWTGLGIVLPAVRLNHPDSAGVRFTIAKLDVDESDPPFLIRDLRGDIAISHDSVFVDIASFHLPGSVGSAKGVITTKDGLGIDVRIEADTVALADIHWVYPTLPTEGGGRMTLTITKAKDSDYTAYALSEMDVRSTRSTLRGAMTFGVTNTLADITDLDVELAPLDFVLIEQFSGEPLPLPWAGTLTGRVRGPGGPLNDFKISEARIAHADANVRGVVNRFVAAGALDITEPALTVFRDLRLTIERLDLATVRAVNPEFAALGGSVAGSLRLDSVWTDVRFRELEMRYADDSLPVSRFVGTGRVTTTDTDLIYDVTLTADSLSFDALAASYPDLPLRGTMAGPFIVRGTMSELTVDGTLSGPAGTVRANVLLDALEPGYAASGRLDLTNVDPARLFVNAARFHGDITAGMDLAVSGDSAANLDGGLKLALDRSRVGDLRVYAGRADLLFNAGRLHVDTLALESSAFTLRGAGALGLAAPVRDSVRFTVQLDSLGGIRPLLTTPEDSVMADSLAGRVSLTGSLRGNLDTLGLDLLGRGRQVIYGETRARSVALEAHLDDLFHARTGTIGLTADTVLVGGLAVARGEVDATLFTRDSASVRGTVISASGPEIVTVAEVHWDSTDTRVRLGTLDIAVDGNTWTLARPSRIVADRVGLRLDSLELRTGAVGRIVVHGALPDAGAIVATVDALDVPLSDLGRLLQSEEAFAGRATLRLAVAGTRDAPTMRFDGSGRGSQYGDAKVEDLRLSGSYADRALTTTIEYWRQDQAVLRAEARIPVDLAFRPVAERFLDAPLTGTIKADSAELTVVEGFTTAIRAAEGRFTADLAINGTWQRPRLLGRVQLANAAFGLPRLGSVRWRDVQGDLQFDADTIHIRRLQARSGNRGANSGSILGWVNVSDRTDLEFDIRVRADQFRVIDKSNVATLDLSTRLRLAGRESGSDLTGSVTVDAGNVNIPDVYRKNVISLDDPEFYRIVDTTVFANRRLLPTAPSAIVENMRVGNVTVSAGPDLWLRSSEANVKLGGSLQVALGRSQRAMDRGERQLALDGTLLAERGTYTLKAGVLQRTFEVEGGTVRFFGDPDNNPALDIAALYTVRQYEQGTARQDVRVRVVLGGSLVTPSIRLESPDSLRISGADLISYLVTGTPSFEVGGRASDYTSTAANVLLGSIGSALGSRLTGGALDLFEVQTGSVGQGLTSGNRNLGSSVLSGARLRGSGQLTERLFLRIDAGLCQVGQLVGSGTETFDPVALADAVGVKVDWRISDVFAISAGMEPSTSALLCASGASARGFAPTPRQWGVDFFRTWRF
jgi:translocation and assembly module TamB